MLKDTDTDMVSMSDVHVNNMANSVLMQKEGGVGVGSGIVGFYCQSSFWHMI